MEQSALTLRQDQTPAQTSPNKPIRYLLSEPGMQTQQVCFMLAGKEYGIDISFVKEIIKPTMEPTPVPQSPPFVEGVIDLRGEIIPILNLRKRFHIKPSPKDKPPTRILVVQVADIIVGLLVDSVTEVLRLNRSQIQDAPGKVVGIDREYIWGVTKRKPEDPLIMLLDIERVLRVEEETNKGESKEKP